MVGGVRPYTDLVFTNLQAALAGSGATFADVVKLAAPPASSLVEVRHLFRQDIMLEIEAVAVTKP